MRVISTISLWVCCCFVLLLTSSACRTEHPSEKTLIQTFKAHHSEFEQLVQMMTEDSEIPPGRVIVTEETGPEYLYLSQERDDQYRTVMKPAGVTSLMVISRELYYFEVSRHLGFFDGSGSTRYYAYSNTERDPESIVENLDEHLANKENPRRACKKLGDGWYLCAGVS